MFKKRGEHKQYRGFFGSHRVWIAITTLVGTTVGAGILGIPYVVSQTGFLYGFVLMLFIGLAFLYLNLFAGEVVLRTKKQHQLPGYAEKYLGKAGKAFMAMSMFISIYGALTAYLIGEGESLYAIFGMGNPLIYSLIFFVVGVMIVYKGIKATGKSELFLISLLFLIIALLGIFSYKNIHLANLSGFNPAFFFLPYGVILFAYIGTAAIPEMQEELVKEKKLMKKAIVIGSVIPIFLYIIFTFIVLGIIGPENFSLLGQNQIIATIALSIYSNKILGAIANVLAVLTMFTSFLTLGTALVEVYNYDFGMRRSFSLLLTFFLPLLIMIFNSTTFIAVLGLVGVLAGGLNGIMVTLMYWKAKIKGDRKPEYSLPKHKILGSILIIIFVVGIIYQVFYQFF